MEKQGNLLVYYNNGQIWIVRFTAFAGFRLLLHLRQHPRGLHSLDENVISGMTVKRRAETLLVKMVTDEADATTENEETVESTDL